VGDSRAIVGRNKNQHNWDALALSVDHKPNLEKEAERIKKMKGRIEAYKDEYGE
jgi:serine/threonine protein phosphatase PrpC